MKQYGWFLAVISTGLLFLLLSKVETGTQPGSSESRIIHTEKREMDLTLERVSRKSPPRSTSPSLIVPSTLVARNEMENHPHSVPLSLVKFADTLAPHFENSMNNESYAQVFFGELQQCALAESADDTARALCVNDARSLAHRHASLLQRWDILQAQLPESIKFLAE